MKIFGKIILFANDKHLFISARRRLPKSKLLHKMIMNTENDIKNLNKKKKFLNLPQKLLRVLKSDNNTL